MHNAASMTEAPAPALAETPILNFRKPMPRNLWAGSDELSLVDYGIVLTVMALSAVGILVVLSYFPALGVELKKLERFMPPMGPQDSPYVAGLYPLGFLAIGILAILFHELGHAFGGSLAGYPLLSITVFPFKVTMRPKRGVEFLRRADPVGLVLFDYSDLTRFSRRYAVMCAAGPAANLLCALIAYPLIPLYSDHAFRWLVVAFAG